MNTHSIPDTEFTPERHQQFCDEMNVAIGLIQRLDEPPSAACLVHEGSDGRVRAYVIGRELRVGRRAVCGLPVPGDGQLSEQHLVVKPMDDNGWEVEDSGSRHGTYLKGHKITRHALNHGDVVRTRNQVFVFHAGPDEVFVRVWAEVEGE